MVNEQSFLCLQVQGQYAGKKSSAVARSDEDTEEFDLAGGDLPAEEDSLPRKLPAKGGATKALSRLPVSPLRKERRVLVTGGAGFVGSHLVDKLIKRGDSVIVIDNYFTGACLSISVPPTSEVVIWLMDSGCTQL